MLHFYIPWKRRGTSSFLTFSLDIQMEHGFQILNFLMNWEAWYNKPSWKAGGAPKFIFSFFLYVVESILQLGDTKKSLFFTNQKISLRYQIDQ